MLLPGGWWLGPGRGENGTSAWPALPSALCLTVPRAREGATGQQDELLALTALLASCTLNLNFGIVLHIVVLWQ
jgi:hypothetical protein